MIQSRSSRNSLSQEQSRQDIGELPSQTGSSTGDDLDLAVSVHRALLATQYAPLSVAEVTVRSRLVILEGRTPSFYLKQVAQAAALTVPGVCQIQNRLQVVRQRS